MSKSISAAAVLCLAGVLFGALGCETSVDPVVGTDKAFTLFGALSPHADTQYVRVYPIEERLAPLDRDRFDLEVRMEDLATDSSFLLQSGPNRAGRSGFGFHLTHSVGYGRAYRITVAGGGRGTTSVRVPVPPEAEWEVGTPRTVGSVRVPVRVLGGAPRLIHTTAEYIAKFGAGGISPQTVDTVRLDYDARTGENGNEWTIPLNLSRDFDLIREELRTRGPLHVRGLETWGLGLIGIRLELMVVNEAWNPRNDLAEFDAERLVQPGTMSNVRNGFGFVGAGYWMDRRIKIDQDVLAEAGFREPYSYQDTPRR